MQEAAARLLLDLLFRPLGVALAQVRRLVSPERPVQTVRRAPALLGRHAAEDLELLRARLLVVVHGSTLPETREGGKRAAPRVRDGTGNSNPVRSPAREH